MRIYPNKFTEKEMNEYRKILAAVKKRPKPLSTHEWYEKNKGVDWGLMKIRRKEYFHTGTTRRYLKMVGLENLIKYDLYQGFFDALDAEVREYEEGKLAR